MSKKVKEQITIEDFKKVKILKKEITKKILRCFDGQPKTASQIANSISFPKEKIYYHIKNLLSNDILFIESRDMVKGIEQTRFLPTAKKFSTHDQIISSQIIESNKPSFETKTPYTDSGILSHNNKKILSEN